MTILLPHPKRLQYFSSHSILLRLLLFISFCGQHVFCHMELSWPYPLRSRFNPQNNFNTIDYSMTSPLDGTGVNYPCKNYHKDANLQSVVTYTAGQSYNVTFAGSATHNGGSCQLSLSYDNGATFAVIKSMIGGCPLSSTYNFKVPDSAPSISKALFAWTWFNKAGNREMYMNCAVVDIVGKTSNGASLNGVQIFKANIATQGTCTTVEGTEPVFPQKGPDVIYGGDYTGRMPSDDPRFAPSSCKYAGQDANVGFVPPSGSSSSSFNINTSTSISSSRASSATSAASSTTSKPSTTTNNISSSAKTSTFCSDATIISTTKVYSLTSTISTSARSTTTTTLSATTLRASTTFSTIPASSSSSSSSSRISSSSTSFRTVIISTTSQTTTSARPVTTTSTLMTITRSTSTIPPPPLPPPPPPPPPSSSSSSISRTSSSMTPSQSSGIVNCSLGNIRCESDGFLWSSCAGGQWIFMGSVAAGTQCVNGAIRRRSDGGDCSRTGEIKCAGDGNSWYMCSDGVYVLMGPVAAGTTCANGAIVAK